MAFNVIRPNPALKSLNLLDINDKSRILSKFLLLEKFKTNRFY